MTTLRKLLLASPLLLLGGCTSLEDGYSIKDRRVDGPQQGARLIESAANEAMTAQTNGAHRAAPSNATPFLGVRCAHPQEWRRGQDLNLRYGFPYTRFPSARLRPLGHLSALGKSELDA